MKHCSYDQLSLRVCTWWALHVSKRPLCLGRGVKPPGQGECAMRSHVHNRGGKLFAVSSLSSIGAKIWVDMSSSRKKRTSVA